MKNTYIYAFFVETALDTAMAQMIPGTNGLIPALTVLIDCLSLCKFGL